jgi:hypothetical protein
LNADRGGESCNPQGRPRIKTQSLAKGKSYFYRITLNDGSVIEFSFKIK